jgi:hypothetical protein
MTAGSIIWTTTIPAPTSMMERRERRTMPGSGFRRPPTRNCLSSCLLMVMPVRRLRPSSRETFPGTEKAEE